MTAGTKTKSMIVLLSVVAFAAGVCSTLVGAQWTRSTAPKYTSRLGAALELTPQQQEQVSKINADWHKDLVQKSRESRRALQDQRDEAIRQLVPAERRPELDAIRTTYRSQVAALEEQRGEAFKKAVTAKIMAILTPQQQKKYVDLLAAGHTEGGRRGAATRDSGTTTERPANP